MAQRLLAGCTGRWVHEPWTRDVYEPFFGFKEAFRDMLDNLHSSEILHDSREFSYLNMLLDQWLQLTGTIDTDIARYQV